MADIDSMLSESLQRIAQPGDPTGVADAIRARVDAGTRVLAMVQSEDGAFVAVRDPQRLSRTVWLPTAVVVPDADQGALTELEVGGCPVPMVEPSVTPVPSPSPSPSPSPRSNWWTTPGPGRS